MFGEIDVKIRQVLSQRFGQNLLSEDDLLKITLRLGEAANETDLRVAAQSLIQEFPFLEDAFMSERHEKHLNLQSIVQKFIPQMITKDPIKAAKLGELAMEKNVSLEALFEFSEEFKNYYYEEKYGK